MMLVRKVGISGVIASYMILLFGGMLLLDTYVRSDMREIHVVMSYQHLMMTSTLYDMSYPLPYSNT